MNKAMAPFRTTRDRDGLATNPGTNWCFAFWAQFDLGSFHRRHALAFLVKSLADWLKDIVCCGSVPHSETTTQPTVGQIVFVV